MTAEEHHEEMQGGIFRASLIRKSLEDHPTEYYPEKVRALNKSYIKTAKEISRQGELFLDKSQNFELGLKVAQITENYKNLLLKLGKTND